MADYYLRGATGLRNNDIDIHVSYKLLVRNAQKRLFIGIGCKLLLKAFFLKYGYGINKVQSDYSQTYLLPYRIDSAQREHLLEADTFTFNKLFIGTTI